VNNSRAENVVDERARFSIRLASGVTQCTAEFERTSRGATAFTVFLCFIRPVAYAARLPRSSFVIGLLVRLNIRVRSPDVRARVFYVHRSRISRSGNYIRSGLRRRSGETAPFPGRNTGRITTAFANAAEKTIGGWWDGVFLSVFGK